MIHFSFKKAAAIALLAILFSNNISAQNLNNYIKGHFNGSIENYSQYYMQDAKIGAYIPPDRYGSNTFLKLDYNYGKFSTGIQLESYMPPILGYFPVPVNNQNKIVNKYFKYTEDKFSIQIGDFYEQFGSGLIFRAYENRQIGINNAMEGINVHVDPTSFLKMKIVYGRTRKIMDYANSVSRGMDAEIDVNNLLGIKEKDKTTHVTLGGSYMSRYEEYTGPIVDFPASVAAVAARLDISSNNFTLSSEYAEKGKDPNLLNNQSFDKGKALQVNTSYTKNNFGVTATFRTLVNMNFAAERETEFTSISPLNFLPALTKQHDYLTSNIYVYSTQVKGEAGFQSDLYYNIKSGSKLGGKYGTKIAANFSYYNGLDDSTDIFSFGNKKYYRDVNIEIKKKWNKKLETTLAFQHIFYNASVIQAVSEGKVKANMIAAGFLYKFAAKKSVRMKLENLSTKDDKGSWASALTEFSFSSPYAFYASDLYNYGSTKIHYYNVGASVTKKSTRFSLGFGKQRAGLFCVGGVCRFVPASYGFTASLTTSFAN
jgi:hypothetical protein